MFTEDCSSARGKSDDMSKPSVFKGSMMNRDIDRLTPSKSISESR